jgi:hypothetical protein
LRAPADPAARTLRITLPAGSAAGVALRVVNPFGEGAHSTIEQLLVEVRPGAAPSRGAIRLAAPARRNRKSFLTAALAIVIATIVVLVAVALSR